MNINDFGKFDSLKEVSEDDFPYSSLKIDQEISEGFINVYKYSFKQYSYTEENELEIAYILPTNNKTKFDTKKLYWQAYKFFKKANYTLSKTELRSQILEIVNNEIPEATCNNTIRCGGYGWGRYIFYENDILCRLDQSSRFHWYFPYLNKDLEIYYCYLFELTDKGVDRENQTQRLLAKRSAFNVDFSNIDSNKK